MTDQQNEGRGALEQQPPRMPWGSIARAAPWTVWGLVALVVVLKMDVITTEDLKVLAEILKGLAG
jgi:hypothetical protein